MISAGSRMGRGVRQLQAIARQAVPALNSVADVRLTLASGTPIVTTGQSAKTSLYLTPFDGNRIALWEW